MTHRRRHPDHSERQFLLVIIVIGVDGDVDDRLLGGLDVLVAVLLEVLADVLVLER